MSIQFWDITRNGVATGEVVEGTGGDAYKRARALGGEYSFTPSEANAASDEPANESPTGRPVLAEVGHDVDLGGVANIGEPEVNPPEPIAVQAAELKKAAEAPVEPAEDDKTKK